MGQTTPIARTTGVRLDRTVDTIDDGVAGRGQKGISRISADAQGRAQSVVVRSQRDGSACRDYDGGLRGHTLEEEEHGVGITNRRDARRTGRGDRALMDIRNRESRDEGVMEQRGGGGKEAGLEGEEGEGGEKERAIELGDRGQQFQFLRAGCPRLREMID